MPLRRQQRRRNLAELIESFDRAALSSHRRDPALPIMMSSSRSQNSTRANSRGGASRGAGGRRGVGEPGAVGRLANKGAAAQRAAGKRTSRKSASRAPLLRTSAAGPERTCVGCGQVDGQSLLVRIVRAESGQLVADLAGKALFQDSELGLGRGAWVHPRGACVDGAARRGLSKSFKAPVQLPAGELRAAVASAGERRLAGLFASGMRARQLAVGADAVVEAWAAGGEPLVVLSLDAAAASKLSVIQLARAAGRLAEWGTKTALGAALGRPDTAVIAVLDTGLASAVSTAVAAAGMVSPTAGEQVSGLLEPAQARAEGAREPRAQIVDESTEDR